MILSEAKYCKETIWRLVLVLNLDTEKENSVMKEQLLDFWKQVESLLIFSPNTWGIILLAHGFSPLEKVQTVKRSVELVSSDSRIMASHLGFLSNTEWL